MLGGGWFPVLTPGTARLGTTSHTPKCRQGGGDGGRSKSWEGSPEDHITLSPL